MENDKTGSNDPRDTDVDALGSDEAHAKSVTDLIDSIERSAFKRYVSMREHHRQYSWSFPDRAEL